MLGNLRKHLKSQARSSCKKNVPMDKVIAIALVLWRRLYHYSFSPLEVCNYFLVLFNAYLEIDKVDSFS